MSPLRLLNQPKAFYVIFFIEFWERFGFYGVQATLVLFMVQQLGFSDGKADSLFAAYAALVFLYPAIGGYIGDRLLGTKRLIILGAITLATGYFLLFAPFLPSHLFELPLAFIAVGNGFFKANPSSLLSKIYQKVKVNQDGGFTLYYMAINVGSLVAFVLVPVVSAYFGWRMGFLCCFVGLVFAIFNFQLMRRLVDDFGSEPDFKPMRKGVFSLVLLFGVAMIAITYGLLKHEEIMTVLLVAGAVVLVGYYIIMTSRSMIEERKGMILFIVLFLEAIVFFVLYFQMPTSMTLFALRNVAHNVFGIPVEPATFQGLNSFWILVLSPLLAMIYSSLSKHQRDLSLPIKFSLGTLLAGLAFVSLWLGCYLSKETAILNSNWVVLAYAFQSAGELLVSALGLSLVSQYVPQRFVGYTMGLWFLATSLASILAGHVAEIARIPKAIVDDPHLSLPIYSNLFFNIGAVTVIIAIIMFCFVPIINKYILNDS